MWLVMKQLGKGKKLTRSVSQKLCVETMPSDVGTLVDDYILFHL